jgi:DNA replication and repair protein RecF
VLAQRNALLGRVRAGVAGREQMRAWDAELGRCGLTLIEDRAAAIAEVAGRFKQLAEELGLDGDPKLLYRPASSAKTADELAGELAERLESDLERGFTGAGPHRDDLRFEREGRLLRSYGSQGQQRLAVLALVLAEREALAIARGRAPLTLLDDVMSELDAERRGRLAELLCDPDRSPGQSVITTTDLAHVPGAERASRVAVADGALLQEALAA